MKEIQDLLQGINKNIGNRDELLKIALDIVSNIDELAGEEAKAENMYYKEIARKLEYGGKVSQAENEAKAGEDYMLKRQMATHIDINKSLFSIIKIFLDGK